VSEHRPSPESGDAAEVSPNSGASGLAPSSAALIVARAAQGLGAAMLTPGALSIIVSTYAGRQRTAA